MKTLIVTFIAIFIYGFINAQKYTLVVQNIATSHYGSNQRTLKSFTDEIIDQEHFNYKEFLKNSRGSNNTFRIGSELLSKESVLKRLRKQSVYADNYRLFEIHLRESFPLLHESYSTQTMKQLYKKLRKRSFRRYVNELPSIL